MFSTPLICCSSGATTVAATTSALAPGYCPVTLMTGGAISGYCATGSRRRTRAEDHEHQRHHGGEDRPIDEEVRDAHGGGAQLAVAQRRRRGGRALAAASCGATLTPGRARIRPLTMTRSSASRPA